MMKKYFSQENLTEDVDCSLHPPVIIRDVKRDNKDYSMDYRRWQSAPCVVRTPGGRVFCTYSGDNSTEAWECPNNYNLISYSDDDGESWKNDAFIIDHEESVRMHEPILWVDPDGRLWHFWSQSYNWWDGRGGVWSMYTDNPDSDRIEWSTPRRLCDGVMATPPTVASDGRWLYPVSIWKYYKNRIKHLPDLEKSNLFVSYDKGVTLNFVGSADEPDTTFDENTIVERDDGVLLMTMRAKKAIMMSKSLDGGKTWSVPEKVMDHASARSYFAKLPSGNLLLVTNNSATERRNMTAFLSLNGGKTFDYSLLLDERCETSYPAGQVGKDGKVYVGYDFNRTTDREVLMAVFKEEDILRGEGGRKKILVSKAGTKLKAEI